VAIKKDNKEYILQKINNNVFKDPYAISDNIRLIGNYLQDHYPDYLFVTPLRSADNRDIIQKSDGYFRVFPFVKRLCHLYDSRKPGTCFRSSKAIWKIHSSSIRL
jgi:hypothetical protein